MSKTTDYVIAMGIDLSDSGNDSPPEREEYEKSNKLSEEETTEFLNYWGKDDD